MGFFSTIWNGLVWLFKMIALPVTKLRGVRGIGQIVRWTLHVLCVLAVTAGLWYLNYALELELLLRAPWPEMRHVWLPTLFLLIYSLAWLGWWLWNLLGVKPPASPFPDIDECWAEVNQALSRARVEISGAPLFLVLGKPASGETSLFNASHLPLSVPKTPKSPAAPFSVFANAEAIYLACSDVSLLGRQATLLEKEAAQRRIEAQAVPSRQPQPAGLARAAARVNSAPGALATATAASTASATALAPGAEWNEEPAAAEKRSPEQGLALLEEGLALVAREIDPALDDEPALLNEPEPQRHVSLLRNVDEVERYTARLRYVCELIEQQRRPYCPVNGIVTLIPWSAADSDKDANQTAILLARDLETVRESTQVDCPLVSVVCDLEQATGCRELLRRFPPEQRHRRLGAPFPSLAECDTDRLPALLEEGVRWVCQDLVTPLAYRLLEAGQEDEADELQTTRGNIELYGFLSAMRDRRQRLDRILARGATAEVRGRGLFGGLYLAATGADVAREQGFVAGVFPQLLEMQNMLAWTPEALADDARCRRWTIAGYTLLGLLVLGVVTAAVAW